MKSELYFVEKILSIHDKESNKGIVVLLKISDKFSFKGSDNHDYNLIELSRKQIENLKEGTYVYYSKQKIERASNDRAAKINIYFNNLYRGKLIKKSSYNESQGSTPISDARLYSYHVNVGHGNCSIIVISSAQKVRFWMIDCSDFDYLNKKTYINHIDMCFEHLKKKFGVKNIKMEKFFLTHPHYDHYSGLGRLINKGIVDSKTMFYINMHYSMPSRNYTKLIKKINDLNPIIVEPLSRYMDNSIEIWHPNLRTIRSMTPKYNRRNDVNVEPSPNNASVIYYFSFGEKSILFPGDIETKGWNTVLCCEPHLKNVNYYAIAHHGSINGHLRTVCPVGRGIRNISDCLRRNSISILMGRDNAYMGIYSDQVILDFNNLVYSERDNYGNPSHFLEIDWNNNSFYWI
jgi:hypothetical protein